MPRPRFYCDETSYEPPSLHHHEPSTSARSRHVHFGPPSPTAPPPLLPTATPRSILRLRPTTPAIPAIPIPPPPPPHPYLFPPPNPPPIPAVYILTYATTLTPSFTSLLASQLPARTPPIHHLYTINAATFPPLPRSMCARYSGIAPEVQDHVMRGAPARVAVQRAVDEILAFGAAERESVRRGAMEVAISVCCGAGTHRSVAVGERIAAGVREAVRRDRRGGGDGVWVVVRHVHRVRGWGDPF